MYVKLSHGDLNSSPYSPHPISTYTYGVTNAPRVHGGTIQFIENFQNYYINAKINTAGLAAAIVKDKFSWWIDPVDAIIIGV